MPTNTQQTLFDKIIEKYRNSAFSERDKGDRFEKLMKAYLKTKPEYKTELSDVWLWAEFPEKSQFGVGGKDTGIDIVCRTFNGDYWAVQCKCYAEDKKVDLKTVGTFITTSQIPFKTENSETKTFSHRIWIDTTKDGFNSEAENAIEKLHVLRLGLVDLQNDSVDWEKLDAGLYGEKAELKKYSLREHQQKAFDATIEYFKTHERGKLIMACGTGKTFTSLRIAEALADKNHLVLFLVPSIALLSQTLKEWTSQSVENIYPICICSDAKASRTNDDVISELALPATTDAQKVFSQYQNFKKRQAEEGGTIVVFSTYQSIDVVSEVQKKINAIENNSFTFDLIVCDEAHRTTGYTPSGKEDSAFVKVHSDSNVKARKRLYMTATPKLFSSEAQQKAKDTETTLWSMDDPEIYGEEIYRIGFGEAVEKKLLSDYKVVVLTLNENSVDPKIQKIILDQKLDGGKEIKADDAIKLIGCINVLSKRTNYLTDKELFTDEDPKPMKSAVAFCSSIGNSKYLRDSFNVCQKAYYENMDESDRADLVAVQADHVDGGMGSTVREEKLEWLKSADTSKKECRVLNNVRCLSEGVDVPSLDAILFLSSRNSQVDVVQSVGRVMRRAEGKKYGYIVIPVVVPAKADADEILDDSDDFKIVWSVLNALRAHDDRFNATINKIELNKKKPKNIRVTGGGRFKAGGKAVVGADDDGEETYTQGTLDFDELQQELYDKFVNLQGEVFAKMVTKCGSRRYWADWGKDVGKIAQRNIDRINTLIAKPGEHQEKFNLYWEGLRKNLNPSVSKQDAVEMLAQHMITKPVFESLFGNDQFTRLNPVSKSLEEIVRLLDEKTDGDDMEKLARFYKSVQQRAEGIDNAEAKQKIVVELYDSFFKNAFPKTVKKLGIVYTPVPVVDFIINSAEYILNKEFGRSLSDENVNIIDPFTGTGTFITRLLQSGIIKPQDLERKYKHEIFANEIVLLAYYIASVNIENVYHDVKAANDQKLKEKINGEPDKNVSYRISHDFNYDYSKQDANNKDYLAVASSEPKFDSYESFKGICLTDTFQLYETKNQETLDDEVFPENSKRANELKKLPITVIFGNPPYSVGQKSGNDNAQNLSYPNLEQSISKFYRSASNATSVKALYVSYVKAFRWASENLDKNNGGVIAFITNSGWIDSNGFDGFRKSLQKDFDSIYVLNLRGAIRGRKGESAKREGQNVFNIMTGVAITVLVRKSEKNSDCKIHYCDIGDYLTRDEKFAKIKKARSIQNLEYVEIKPNKYGDWITTRNDLFATWIPIDCEKKYVLESQSLFLTYSLGVATGRDMWAYSFSKKKLYANVKLMAENYNSEVERYQLLDSSIKDLDSWIDSNPSKIAWNRNLKESLQKKKKIITKDDSATISFYRPFCKQNFYFHNDFNAMQYQQKRFYPNNFEKNVLIIITGLQERKGFSTLITNCIPDLNNFDGGCQCFPLYWYEEVDTQGSLFGSDGENYVRHDAVSDFILNRAQGKYGNKVTKEDIFYYVYGLLHSKSYRETFAADLKKMLPRIPLVSDYKKFFAFVDAGKKLATLHLNYENQPTLNEVQIQGDLTRNDYEYFEVQQMAFIKKDDKSAIRYNNNITVSNIPLKAYDYIVNGQSAIEHVMEWYGSKKWNSQAKKSGSGIVNNPNDWSREHSKPRYILDLLLSVINVSVQTVDIVNSLPQVDWEKE